ncbi:AraC-like DNA-binding protein [Pedobacter sp. AK017]|uniref:AraC family transcriptional regulator n=1 Tax=Pedobacter sp. AK017 TaxID=2723073 RepID=UPI001615C75B|nr:helix-turn-helix domain-containing protein [Pedobacter sp. AK017]MBB5440612.1 AraC-like DNA-binding protein [Pedobacter sp. AK017]
MLHLSLIVLRLSVFYKNEFLEVSNALYYRLFWVDNGRGMVFLHAGLKEAIKQFNLTDGWIVLFKDNLYRDFLSHFPQAKDMLLFTRIASQGFIKMDYQMLIRFNQYAVDLQILISKNSPALMMQPILDTMLLHAGMQFDRFNDLKLNSWVDQQYVQIDRLIQAHFREEQPDTFYADASGLTLQQLNNICRKVKGRSILPLVGLARLSAAQSELANTSKSVKEIALDLGFKTDSHFSNFFKRATSMTPLEYRAYNSSL